MKTCNNLKIFETRTACWNEPQAALCLQGNEYFQFVKFTGCKHCKYKTRIYTEARDPSLKIVYLWVIDQLYFDNAIQLKFVNLEFFFKKMTCFKVSNLSSQEWSSSKRWFFYMWSQLTSSEQGKSRQVPQTCESTNECAENTKSNINTFKLIYISDNIWLASAQTYFVAKLSENLWSWQPLTSEVVTL